MKHTKATKYIVQAAQRCMNGKITVDCDSRYSTVSIDCPGKDSIFMQGDEADQFIAERDALCKRFPSLEYRVAELSLAEPYSECIWG